MLDRQIGDPLHSHHLPLLAPEHFVKQGDIEVKEFKEHPDGRLERQVEWQKAP